VRAYEEIYNEIRIKPERLKGSGGNEMKPVVYFLPSSADFQRAKQFFTEKGVEFEEKNVENPEFLDELVKGYHSLTLPTIVLGDEVILGFGINKNKIMEKLTQEE
jgi:glutaredoxin